MIPVTNPGERTESRLVSGVDFASLPTADLDAAIAFYGDVLGLPQSRHYDRIPGAEFETGNLTLQLFDYSAVGSENKPHRAPIALHVEDLGRLGPSSSPAASPSTVTPSTAVSAAWPSSRILTATC